MTPNGSRTFEHLVTSPDGNRSFRYDNSSSEIAQKCFSLQVQYASHILDEYFRSLSQTRGMNKFVSKQPVGAVTVG